MSYNIKHPFAGPPTNQNLDLNKLQQLAERSTGVLFMGIQPATASDNDLSVAVSPDVVLGLIAHIRSQEAEVKRLSEIPDSISSFSEGKRLVAMLKKNNQALRAQLAEAREVVKFYANKQSWLREPDADIACKIVPEDCETVTRYSNYCGGKSARAHLEKYK